MHQSRIVIRDIHRYGDDLTVHQAIARLCDGGPVTVTVTDPTPPGGDPRGNPRPGFDIEVAPAGASAEPALTVAAWDTNASRSADDAAWYAGALSLACDLASRASLGQAAPAQAAVIGGTHGRDAARRALAAASPDDCLEIITRLDSGDTLVYGMFETPALSGEHDIGYDDLDLAADLGLDPGNSDALAAAADAYFTAAGEAFWHEAQQIARDRAPQAAPAHHRSAR